MKRLCLAFLFCLVLSVARADTGWFGGDVVSVKCLPKIQSIEIYNRNGTHFDYSDFSKENRLKALEKNYFIFENEQKRDLTAETKCEFASGLYEIKFQGVYYASNRILVTILKNGKPVVSDLLLYDQFSEHKVHIPFLRYNALSDELEIFGLKRDNVESEKLSYIKWKNETEKSTQKVLEYPEKWPNRVFLKNSEGKAFLIGCDDYLEDIDVRFVHYQDERVKAILDQEALDLVQYGIYAFEADKVPAVYQTKCLIKGKTYEIKIDKKTNLMISRDGEVVISGIRLYEAKRNELISYLRYKVIGDWSRPYDAVQIAWWNKDKNEFSYNRLPESPKWEDYDENERLWKLESMDDFYGMKKDICSMVWCD